MYSRRRHEVYNAREQRKLWKEAKELEAEKRFQQAVQHSLVSRNYDDPVYKIRIEYNGKYFIKPSKCWNVSEYAPECSNVVVGTWNDKENRIDFVEDLLKKMELLEIIESKHNSERNE
jgi:hypothetical protein